MHSGRWSANCSSARRRNAPTPPPYLHQQSETRCLFLPKMQNRCSCRAQADEYYIARRPSATATMGAATTATRMWVRHGLGQFQGYPAVQTRTIPDVLAFCYTTEPHSYARVTTLMPNKPEGGRQQQPRRRAGIDARTIKAMLTHRHLGQHAGDWAKATLLAAKFPSK